MSGGRGRGLGRDELLAVVDDAPEAVVLIDRDGWVRLANRAATRWLGGEEVVGRPLERALPDPDGELTAVRQRAERTGQPGRVVSFSPTDATWLELQIRPVRDGLVLRAYDITERRREELVGTVITEVATAATAQRGTVPALVAAGASLRRVTDHEFAAVWLRDRAGTVRLVACDHASSPALADVADELRRSGFPGDGPARRCLDEGVPRPSRDLSADLGPAVAGAVAAAGLRTGLHVPLRWPDGSAAIIGLLSRHGPDEDDWPTVLGLAHDRLSALAVRVRDHQELAQLFDLARSGLCITSVDGRFHRINPELATMLGRPADELISQSFLEFIHPDDHRALADRRARLLADGESAPFEHRAVLPTGEERTLSWVSRPSPSEGLVFSAAHDVTDQRRRERSEQQQRRLLEGIALGEPFEHTLRGIVATVTAQVRGAVEGEVWVTDSATGSLRPAGGPVVSGHLRDEGESAARETMATGRAVLGVQPVGSVATCWAVPLHSQDDEPCGAVVLAVDRGGGPTREELAVLEDAGRLASVALAGHRMRTSLQRSEERFRLLAGVVADALWDWDLVEESLWFNDGFLRAFGFGPVEAADGLALWQRNIHDQERARVLASVDEALASGHTEWETEYRFRCGDGRQVLVRHRGAIMRDGRGHALRLVGGMWDLSSEQEREVLRERTRSLARLGTLAGGLAHDLGNMLAPIQLGAEMLASYDLDETCSRLVGRIDRSARRGNDMIKQVMSLARGTSGQRRPVEVAPLLATLRDHFAGLEGEHVTFTVDVADELPPVLGDESQLHQVLLNLVANAIDAMPDGGTVTLSARRVATGRGGEQVRLGVEDTGTGMSDEVRERIFEPFFTTKPTDEGTGLGMAVTMTIVESHGGDIDVRSQPGQGTRVSVDLPTVAAAPDHRHVPHDGTYSG